MTQEKESTRLSEELRERVLARLGFSAPPSPDLEGLRELYGAWCMRVPFDNVRKMIALLSGDKAPLPGGEAEDFFAHWLRDGVGGTCWPSSNALFTLIESLGFEARRIAGSMRDLGIPNHGSVKVRLAGRDWLVDSSLLYVHPLPLDRPVTVVPDPLFAVEVEAEEGTHVVWMDVPPSRDYLCCRLLEDPVTHAFYLARYELSREQSPFNHRLHARRNRPGEMVALLGATRVSKTAGGVEIRDLSPDEVCHSLRDEIGLSPAVIDAWVRAGGLTATFEAPPGPKPPPASRKPPSQRGELI